MKALRGLTNSEKHRYMRHRKEQNRIQSKRSSAETKVVARLKQTPWKWSRQSTWGYRLFDFWCKELGVVIEVDGPEHDQEYDSYRDEYNFRRSGIVVLRIQNHDERELEETIKLIPNPATHKMITTTHQYCNIFIPPQMVSVRFGRRCP